MKTTDKSDASFESIITSRSLYVDKTQYLYNLITDGGTYYTCLRPHGFGKTLALSTLDTIFRGRKELFRGLCIASTGYDWKKYPVLHLDFSTLRTSSKKQLQSDLVSAVTKAAAEYGITINGSGSEKSVYGEVISRLSNLGKVVILIDEYDSPVMKNIQSSNPEALTEVLRGFFDVLKGCSPCIRFCLMTGTVRFYTANNFADISMKEELSLIHI